MKKPVIAVALIAAGVPGLFLLSLFTDPYSPPYVSQSNGERIYFTAISSPGKPITVSIP